MPPCYVCGTNLDATARTCTMCGTSVPDSAPSADAKSEPTPVATDAIRICPLCLRRYDGGYADTFCVCGGVLSAEQAVEALPVTDAQEQKASAPQALPLEFLEKGPSLASRGPRLVVYSEEGKPIFALALDRDVTRIGRNDPVRGDFAELDVGVLFDAETARKVSRKHAMILRSRESGTYVLRALAHNTGTQVGSEFATELADYPLTDGMRIVLGGAVRIKFHS